MMDDPKNNNTFLETVKQIAKRLDKLLFQPSANVTDERDRLRAYVTSILLSVIFLGLLYGVIRIITNTNPTSGPISLQILVVGELIIFVGYGLSRTKYYLWGLGLAFIPMLMLPYRLLLDPVAAVDQIETVDIWLVVPLLVGGLLLPRASYYGWLALVVIAVPIIQTFTTPPESGALTMAVFVFMCAVLIGFTARFQAQLETQALRVIQVKNLAEKEGIIEQLQRAEALQKQRAMVIEASYEINTKLATILDPHQLVNEVINQIQALFHYNYVQFYLVDDTSENLVVAGGTGEAGQLLFSRRHQIPMGKGLVGQAAATNTYVLVDDVSQIGTWISNPLLPNTKSELAVPIAVGDTVLGVLDVQHDEVSGLTAEDVALLQSVATAVAISLQNARLYEQVNKRAEQEAVVNQINQQILSAPTMERVLEIAARELGQYLGVHRATVQLSRVSKENGRHRGEKN
jgi:putative methionine-R-sulfoxide reductase with GAF domain